jgi:hypothetical protein
MESKLRRPDSNHTPKRDEARDDIGNDEHVFGPDFPVTLDVPETKGTAGTMISSRLSTAQAQAVQTLRSM